MLLKIKNFIFISLLAGLIFYLSSCNDQPMDIPLVSDTLNLKTISSDSIELFAEIVSEKNPLNVTFNQSYQFVGSYNEMEAISMIRYSQVPDSIPVLDINRIVSAKMWMYPDRYYYGDTTNVNLGFEVRELLDTLKINLTYDEVFNQGKTYFGANNLAEYDAPVTLKGVEDPDSIVFDIDKEIIKKWVEFAAIEDETDDPYKFYSYGIVLLPKENSSMNGIFRFDTYRPTDELDYSEYISTRELPKIEVIYNSDTNNLSILDTFYLDPVNVSYYVDGPEPESDAITIQGAISTRTRLSFNLDTIPEFASILSAEMRWTLDPERSEFGVFGPDSAIWGSILEDFANFATDWQYEAFWEDSTYTFIFPGLASAIERWNTLENPGVFTFIAPRKSNPAEAFDLFDNRRSPAGELYFLDKYVFHGLNDPDPTKRPKLLIIYTENPEDFE